MRTKRILVVAKDPESLALEAAGRWVELVDEAIRNRGLAHIALSGGSTPKKFYQRLASAPFNRSVDWSKVHLWFADERFVPHDHPESTTRLVRETLLCGIDLPDSHFHPMPTDQDDPDAMAEAYAKEFEAFMGACGPGLDLALLGMGPDGHTASLFPGHPIEEGIVVAIQNSPKPPPIRLTLTLETLRRSRQVWFLVTGADKADVLDQVFAKEADDTDALPAAQVHDIHDTSLWLTDPQAASCLPSGLREP